MLDNLKRPEGKTLEFKRDLSSPGGVLRTLVAFANTAGGVLLIGVEDRSRQVRGVTAPLDVEERLASMIIDSIVPRLLPDLEILPWRGTHLLAVQVYPSPSRPHHVKREGPAAGAYVRVGSTNRRADREMLEEMKRFALGESYDEQPMPEFDSEAIDFRAASVSFSALRRLKRSDLETLRLLTRHQGRQVPTVGGLLLFGRDRSRHFPDAWIQAGRFGGKDKTRITDQLEIRSGLVEAVDAAIAFVQKHSQQGVEIGPVRRTARWSVPPAALREAVINAVAHTDYAQRGAPIRISVFDDRLEIENPGLLPFGLTVEDLPRGISKLRNRVIGRVFHELGLIEQWGSGIQRMAAACRDAGMALPVLEELGTRFRVTLFTARSQREVQDPIDQAILDILASGEGCSTQQIATAIALTSRTARTRLKKLVEGGLVSEIGTSPKDPKRRYFRTATN